MNPIMHDSEDWREVQRKLNSLENGQTDIRGEVKRIAEKQDAQHHANKETIETMKIVLLGDPENLKDNPGLVIKMDRLLIYGQATAFWGKVGAWLLGILIAGLTLYFSSLEVRSKVGELMPKDVGNSAMPVVASSQQNALQ